MSRWQDGRAYGRKGGWVAPERPSTSMTLRIAGLWRYPVKSLAGEPLQRAQLAPAGIPGDRIVHVRGPEGVRTARRQHRLLGLKGGLGRDGEPTINGLCWRGSEALDLVRGAAGRDAWLEVSDQAERFDVLPLLVATDGAVAAFGRDIRRLRPNILIGGVVGMAEVDWPGAELHIGEAVIRLDSLRPRCPMTTVDPDTLDRDPAVLRDIGRRFRGRLALNAAVLRPGVVKIGDNVVLVHNGARAHARPSEDLAVSPSPSAQSSDTFLPSTDSRQPTADS